MVLYKRLKNLCGVPSGGAITAWASGSRPTISRHSVPFPQQRPASEHLSGCLWRGFLFPCSMRRRRFHCVCVRRHV
eukprot:scaffold130797_cov30-Phaeocystis_antarctica.AAC.1